MPDGALGDRLRPWGIPGLRALPKARNNVLVLFCEDREEAFMRTGITSTFVPLLHEDGRVRFEAPKRASVLVLEATLAILWILSAAVLVVAPILWF